MPSNPTRLDRADENEMRDAMRCLSPIYSDKFFDSAFAEFVQIKKSVLRHRAKVAKRRALH